ncbi:MAG: hypothetical protein Q7K28_03735 [Candidatus Wildermuthbacteria bacterium]|nr:hypothetical protein [Candidatus Wildermuthbacteria bacterium]
MDIYCLRVGGQGLLTDEIRRCLFRGAQLLLIEEQYRRVKAKNEGFECEIRTDLKWVGFGGVNGILFAARIELDDDEATVEYIVPARAREIDIKKEVWPDDFFFLAPMEASRN